MTSNYAVEFQLLTSTAIKPAKATEGSSGFDLYADAEMDLLPGQYGLVSTGISISMAKNLEGQIRPRSGLATKYGITVLNSPGTIDSDYRGEVKVLLVNSGTGMFRVSRGDRIAQLVFQELPSMVLFEVKKLDNTERGAGGFGSTGI